MIERIAHLIKTAIQDQEWADVVAGIVLPFQKKLDSDPARYTTYAIACDVSGKECTDDDLFALFPDDSKRSVIFFEDRSGILPVGVEDMWLKFQCTIRVVGWINPPMMGHDSSCGGCSTGFEVAMAILNLLPARNYNITDCHISALNVAFKGMAPKGENVFARYSAVAADRKPWNLLPYEHFGLDLLCTWRTHISCFTGPTVGEPICPSSPSTDPGEPGETLCPIVRVCLPGIEVGMVPVWDGEKWVYDTIEGGGVSLPFDSWFWDPDPAIGGLIIVKDGQEYQATLTPRP